MNDSQALRYLEAASKYFDLGTVQSANRMISINATYAITTSKGIFFLKLFFQRSRRDVEKEFVYLKRLEEHHFPIPHFLLSPTGSPIFQDNNLIAIAMLKAEGEERPLSEALVYEVGLKLAQLHTIPLDLLPRRSHWLARDYLPERINGALQSLNQTEQTKLMLIYRSVQHLNPDIFPQSIIHGDLHPSNCLYQEDKLTAILDWEDVGIGASLLDFAWCVLSFCFTEQLDEKRRLNAQLYSSLFKGYCCIRPFEEVELNNIEIAIRYTYLTFCVWILMRSASQRLVGKSIKRFQAFQMFELDTLELLSTANR